MLGDVFLVKECIEVRQFVVHWNQKYNGTCYNLPPVMLKNKTLAFLEIVSRRVTRQAHKIDCASRPKELYIEDMKGNFWKYTRDQNFTKVIVKTQIFHHGELKLPQLANYDERLMHFEENQPNRLHLLHLVAMQQINLQEIADLRTGCGKK